MHLNKKITRIGLFDSGIGGLTVLKELMNLPFTDCIYIADTANVPYGQKTPEQILQYSHTISAFLIEQKIDALVIACHTSSAIALPYLHKMFPQIPIIGTIIQTMLHATKQTRNGRIGIMATQASINSHIHKKELLAINPALEVFEQACPQLVTLIESPMMDMQEIQNALRHYLTPLIDQNIDTLILGCTHYPLLAKEIKKIVGEQITLISSEKIITQILSDHCQKTLPETKSITFYATGDTHNVEQKIKMILGDVVTVKFLDVHTHCQ
ncbi:MAG: glutamate racemase, partial [Candidatus Babeliales bacterium]|nr:glutamate racemase [Candidatus Babeliales bacterium]